MPSEETTYWCSVHKSFSLESPQYLVAVSVVVSIHALFLIYIITFAFLLLLVVNYSTSHI